MIGIRECVPHLNEIRDEHIGFVNARVNAVADFYGQTIRQLLDYISGATSAKDCIGGIMALKRKHRLGDYKKLLSFLLKPGASISSEKECSKLLDQANFKKTMLPIVSDKGAVLINGLSADLTRLLEVDFDDDASDDKLFYKLSAKKYKFIAPIIPFIIDYDTWFSKLSPNAEWGPYQLTQALGLKVCPYCNMSYIYTVVEEDGKKIARAQLDHFMPQKRNPLLALSFFNLIPSCGMCNSSIKGKSDVKYDTHLSPYRCNFKHALMRFFYSPLTTNAIYGITDEVEINVLYNGASDDTKLKQVVDANINLFCLEQLYAFHSDVVREVVWKRHQFNDASVRMLKLTFENFDVTKEDAYQVYFANYFNESDFHKRPLAKLVKDIAIELSVLPDAVKKTDA